MSTVTAEPIEYASMMSDDPRVDRLLRQSLGWTTLVYGGGLIASSVVQVVPAILNGSVSAASSMSAYGRPDVLLMFARIGSAILLFIGSWNLLRRRPASIWLLRIAVGIMCVSYLSAPFVYSWLSRSAAMLYLQPLMIVQMSFSIVGGCAQSLLIALLTLRPIADRMLRAP